MNSRNALLALFGGVVLTTLVGILLTPYKDSSKRKKTIEKVRDHTDNAEETIKGSVVNGQNRLKKMSEDTARMVNEGGNAL